MVVQAVVRDEDRVLLAIRSDLRGWELPGGTVDRDETPERALQREVREETGLEIVVGRHIGDYRRTGFRPHVARVFECRKTGGRLRTSRETRALGWFHPLLVPDTLFPWFEQPLRDAFVPDAPAVDREERHGLAEIRAGMRIDLRMRWRGDPSNESAPVPKDEGASCEIERP